MYLIFNLQVGGSEILKNIVAKHNMKFLYFFVKHDLTERSTNA